MTSHILACYNKPEEDYDGEIPEEIIDTIEIPKEASDEG
jgi:hypothetical protein